MSKNLVENIENLSELKALNSLSLADNKIKTLGTLIENQNLEVIYF